MFGRVCRSTYYVFGSRVNCQAKGIKSLLHTRSVGARTATMSGAATPTRGSTGEDKSLVLHTVTNAGLTPAQSEDVQAITGLTSCAGVPAHPVWRRSLSHPWRFAAPRAFSRTHPHTLRPPRASPHRTPPSPVLSAHAPGFTQAPTHPTRWHPPGCRAGSAVTSC